MSRLLSFTLTVLGVLVLPVASARAVSRTGEEVGVAAGERVVGNLYLSGSDVSVHGDVLGDLVAFGGTIVIDGHVTGDVLAAGGEIKVNGVVDGDVRAAGGNVTLLGAVAGDAAAVGGDVTVAGQVGHDVFVGAGRSQITGDIGGALALGAGEAQIAGTVQGSVTAEAGRLRLERSAVLGSDLTYRGDELVRTPGAAVVGRIVEKPGMHVGLGVVGWLRALVGMCLFGVLWLTLFRGFAERAIDNLASRPLPCVGIGAAVFFGAPLAIGLSFVLGALVGGWWIAFIGLALYAIALVITFPLLAAFVGRRLLYRRRTQPRLGEELIGMVAMLVVFALIGIIPLIGALLALAVLLFGLGAIAVTLLSTLRRTREPRPARAEPLMSAAAPA